MLTPPILPQSHLGAPGTEGLRGRPQSSRTQGTQVNLSLMPHPSPRGLDAMLAAASKVKLCLCHLSDSGGGGSEADSGADGRARPQPTQALGTAPENRRWKAAGTHVWCWRGAQSGREGLGSLLILGVGGTRTRSPLTHPRGLARTRQARGPHQVWAAARCQRHRGTVRMASTRPHPGWEEQERGHWPVTCAQGGVAHRCQHQGDRAIAPHWAHRG